MIFQDPMVSLNPLKSGWCPDPRGVLVNGRA